MGQEKISLLRARMIEDMRIRGMTETSQKAHIWTLKDFTTFLVRSPDTAKPGELRAYQFRMTDTEVTPSVCNARITALRFFFGMTWDREDMKKYMHFCTKPRKMPVVLNLEEVSAVLSSVLGSGLTYRAAFGVGYGAGLCASAVTNLKMRDIDSDRMLIHVERGKVGKDCDVMLSPPMLVLLPDYSREARPQGWLFSGQSLVTLCRRDYSTAPSTVPRPWQGSRSPRPYTRSGTALLRIF